MSDEPEGNGGGNRATVAVAVEKIDGLREFTRAEFGEVKDRIGKLEGLPERVVRLETTQAIYARLPDALGGVERVAADHEHRIIDLERAKDRDSASWLIHWPTLIPALIALIVAIAAIYFK